MALVSFRGLLFWSEERGTTTWAGSTPRPPLDSLSESKTSGSTSARPRLSLCSFPSGFTMLAFIVVFFFSKPDSSTAPSDLQHPSSSVSLSNSGPLPSASGWATGSDPLPAESRLPASLLSNSPPLVFCASPLYSVTVLPADGRPKRPPPSYPFEPLPSALALLSCKFSSSPASASPSIEASRLLLQNGKAIWLVKVFTVKHLPRYVARLDKRGKSSR